MLNDLRYRFRALFRRDTMDRELEDELRFHLEKETAKLVNEGVAHDEARRRARASFGGVERIKDDTRDARGLLCVLIVPQADRILCRLHMMHLTEDRQQHSLPQYLLHRFLRAIRALRFVNV